MLKKMCLFTCISFLFTLNHSLISEENESIHLRPLMPPDYSDDKIAVKDVIESQVDAMKSSNFSRAYYSLTTEDFRKVTSIEDFKKFTNHFTPFFKNKSVSINSFTFHPEVTIVLATLTSLDESSINVQYQLKKIEDEWKIAGIQVLNVQKK